MNLRFLRLLYVGVVLGGYGCASEPASPPAPRVTSVGVPNRSNDFASMAADGSVVTLAWAASTDTGTDIFTATSTDGGVSFGSPVRVNHAEGQANANVEQPPRVAFTSERATRQIVVLWSARGEGGTLLLTARSNDEGRTFAAAEPVPGSNAAGNRGWESLTVDSNGRPLVMWLDHRDTAMTAADHSAHQHGGAGAPTETDGAARAQRSQLFVGGLDGSVEARGVTRGVCYCCKTALAAGADGVVYAAWRHVYAGNFRDIAFAMSSDGGRSFTEPVRVSEDEWQIDGCPENGPALAVDGKRVYVIWPTLVRDGERETLKLFLSSTTDGRAFTPRVALPTVDPAYHPQLVRTPDGDLITAWDELTASGRRVRVARGRPDASGAVRFSVTTQGGDTTASNPSLAVSSSGVIAAWTSGTGPASTITVTRLKTKD